MARSQPGCGGHCWEPEDPPQPPRWSTAGSCRLSSRQRQSGDATLRCRSPERRVGRVELKRSTGVVTRAHTDTESAVLLLALALALALSGCRGATPHELAGAADAGNAKPCRAAQIHARGLYQRSNENVFGTIILSNATDSILRSAWRSPTDRLSRSERDGYRSTQAVRNSMESLRPAASR